MANHKIVCDLSDEQFLEAFYKFHKLYEEKLKHIEYRENSLDMQVNLLKKWVKDLTEQNILLAHLVLDLEKEAIKRIQITTEEISESKPDSSVQAIEIADELKTLQGTLKSKDEIIEKLQEKLNESTALTSEVSQSDARNNTDIIPNNEEKENNSKMENYGQALMTQDQIMDDLVKEQGSQFKKGNITASEMSESDQNEEKLISLFRAAMARNMN